MKIGLGVLGYTPDTFWSMTVNELAVAYEGYLEANGHKKERFKSKEEAKNWLHNLRDQVRGG